MPAEPPWNDAPGTADASVGRPSSPPLGEAPGGGIPPWGGPPPPSPPPPLHPSTPSAPSRSRGVAFAIAAALVIGALLGAGLGNVVHLHGARPTLSGSAAPTTVPVFPGTGGSAAPSNPTTPSGGTGGGTDSAAIAAAVNPSIVDVNTVSSYRGGAGAGTGMILTSNGDILTNNHVVDGATSISVTLVSNGRTYKADVVGTAPTEDIAVIHIKGVSGLKPISIGELLLGGTAGPGGRHRQRRWQGWHALRGDRHRPRPEPDDHGQRCRRGEPGDPARADPHGRPDRAR